MSADAVDLRALVDSGAIQRGMPAGLPVPALLRGLLPGGLSRTTPTAVGRAVGGQSLVHALMGAVSARSEAWIAVVGMPDLGVLSLIEHGVDIERLAAVPDPGPDWLDLVGVLVDGFDLVVVRPPTPVTERQARRVATRARHRRCGLLIHGGWPAAPTVLTTSDPAWCGLGQGRGRLRGRQLTVSLTGRGSARRGGRIRVWLPDRHGRLAAVSPDQPERCDVNGPAA